MPSRSQPARDVSISDIGLFHRPTGRLDNEDGEAENEAGEYERRDTRRKDMFRSMWMFLGVGALALGSVACGGSDETSDATAPPEPVVELVDDWLAAAEAGDGSVTDLYLPTGYHLYGDQRIDRDAIAAHLEAPGYEHEWITDTMLVADDDNGNYVVVRGMRNSTASESDQSALTFEVVTDRRG